MRDAVRDHAELTGAVRHRVRAALLGGEHHSAAAIAGMRKHVRSALKQTCDPLWANDGDERFTLFLDALELEDLEVTAS